MLWRCKHAEWDRDNELSVLSVQNLIFHAAGEEICICKQENVSATKLLSAYLMYSRGQIYGVVYPTGRLQTVNLQTCRFSELLHYWTALSHIVWWILPTAYLLPNQTGTVVKYLLDFKAPYWMPFLTTARSCFFSKVALNTHCSPPAQHQMADS